MSFDFPAGSQFRRWDLHLHTPATVLNNQFKPASGPESWDAYFEAINATDLSVIASTNYFCADGFTEVLAACREGRLPRVLAVLLNVEFRVEQKNKDGEQIHIHVIFSDQLTHSLGGVDRVNEWLGRLPLFSTDPNMKTLYCDKRGLTKVGFNSATVDLKKLQEHLESDFIFFRDYIILAGCRGQGSFRPQANDGRGAEIAVEIDKACSAVYGSSDEDVLFFLDSDRHEAARPKPVFEGSDAHDLESVGRCGTWIKADPGYEGLKQAILEPRWRVKIQHEQPGKKPRMFVRSVRVLGGEGSTLFSPEPIQLSEDLTAVIGGKSTGKSLLLHYMAMAVDPAQVISRVGAVTRGESVYDLEQDPSFGVEVTWGDGRVDRLSGSEQSDTRPIVYLPQLFLNSVCEVKPDGSASGLKEFIRSVLERDEAARSALATLKADVASEEEATTDALDGLWLAAGEADQKKGELAQFGDEKGLKDELDHMDETIAALRKSSGLSDEEQARHASLSDESSKVNARSAVLAEDLASVATSEVDLLKGARKFEADVLKAIQGISDPALHAEAERQWGGLVGPVASVEVASTAIAEIGKALVLTNEERRKELGSQLAPLAEKMEAADRLADLQVEREVAAESLRQLRDLKRAIGVLDQTQKDALQSVLRAQERLMQAYETARRALMDQQVLQDVQLDVRVGFDDESLNSDVVEAVLNKRDLAAARKKKLGEAGYEYDPAEHVAFLSTVLEGLAAGTITPKAGHSAQEAMRRLLINRFRLDYLISYMGDSIDRMSPGKRALVALKIVVELTDDEWPILLDQPDDDLDSRSVYESLVRYIQDRKQRRQFIVVTHNPNLVVGADAECVVVANQDGQELGRENEQFRFEYVSGSLECTFVGDQTRSVLARQGIREHVCEILEGGEEAFRRREEKYAFADD